MLHHLVLLCSIYSVVGCIKSSDSNPKALRDIVIPRTGPCVLNKDKLKCDENGYYEMVQCDDNGCYCVDVHTGTSAIATKTSNNKITPQCSICHNTLRKIFSQVPPKDAFIPKCTGPKGDFAQIQCIRSPAEECYCVDEKTGKEMIGSRKKMAGNPSFTCDRNEFSIDASPVNDDKKDSTPSTSTSDQYPVGREYCKMDRDKGQNCTGKKPSIMYHFDVTSFECLAFEYLGCGGNENKYNTKHECYSTCVLADFSGCAGKRPPAKSATGEVLTCGGPQLPSPTTTSRPSLLNADGCPRGHRCVMGAFFGMCCNKDVEDKYLRAYRPTCKSGVRPHSSTHDGYTEAVLGKSCSDNFCPKDRKCLENDIFAYCC